MKMIAKDIERQLTLLSLRGGGIKDHLEDGAIYLRRMVGRLDYAAILAHGGNGLSSEEDVVAWFAVEHAGFVPDIVPEEDGSRHWLVARPPSDKQRRETPRSNITVFEILPTAQAV